MYYAAELIFWFSFLFILYTYIGYPAVVYLWSLVLPKAVGKGPLPSAPYVSVLIAARNEVKNIEGRIRDLTRQTYPKDKMEIIVISDGSGDGTVEAVERLRAELNGNPPYHGNFLSLISYPVPQGKPHALNAGAALANGEFIVFTDSRQSFAPDTVEQLIRNFKDDKVGCVSGELVFKKSSESSIEKEMTTYWDFEKNLRMLESVTGSVTSVTGAVYAVRKKLFRPIPPQTLLDDVYIPVNVRLQGYRVIFDRTALAYDKISQNLSQEKRRKIRTLAGNWQLLLLQPVILNPFKNPLWFKFLSHKVFRLLVPYFVITLLLASFYTLTVFSYVLLALSLLFVALALFPSMPGYLKALSGISKLCRTVLFFNYFALLAPINLISSGEKLWHTK